MASAPTPPKTSRECRWFFAGELPEPVEASFRELRPWPRAGDIDLGPWPGRWREDTYLVIPGHEDLGLKWRDDRDRPPPLLEFKGRTRLHGLEELGRGREAIVDSWSKWSYAVAEDSPFARLFDDPRARAVRVEKKRLLRLLRLGEELAEVGDEFVEQGLQVELTRVRASTGDEPSTWWTLGFEAFPDDARLDASFLPEVCAFVRELSAAAELVERTALSYPAWLARGP